MATITKRARLYIRRDPPSLPDERGRYIAEELKRIEQALKAMSDTIDEIIAALP